MPTDLQIIEQLEKAIGKKLRLLKQIDSLTNGYVIDDNKNIIGLSLFDTQITDISVLKELKNLMQLDLSSNKITDYSILKELTNLTQLSLSDNQITDISALKELTNLTQLSLSDNQITDISVLKELKNLTQLDLRNNQITDISALKELKNLTLLSLRNNQITDISVLKELTNLTQLSLSVNQITDISVLKELKNLTRLDLWNNQITEISALKDLTNLTQLSLSDNQITDISILKELKNLTRLDLWNNQITDISVLKELKNLTQLDLRNNQITDISILKELKNLTLLSLRNNQITDISVLKELTNLMRLDLSSNKITDHSILKELTNLTRLDLWNNQITDISILKELTNLTQLSLWNNQITDISILKELTNLTRLDLWNNQITDISVLKELPNLTQLNLSSNKITDYSVLNELTNLTQLDLWNNQITDISVLKELPNLTRLDLSSNKITDYSILNELTNLTQLDLRNNQITDISILKELTNLTQLDLRNNQITDISILKELKNLTRLDLWNNQITDISVLKELTNLTQLNLRNNQITDISVLKELTNLTQLDLSSNKITHLHSEIVDMGMAIRWEGYSGIILKNNPLESPPIEIVKSGREAVKAYFKSLEGEKQALNEVKVLLVGDGGAGKTSLVKQLLGENFDEHESQTHGINIRDWNVEDIIVHFWDFGGQEIMHATHQFFLSKRSLYILVLDGRKDKKTEYWLKHIESFGGDSPVLVVINKIDENPGFDVNRRFLQEKYNGIQNFYRVSCAKSEGINGFAEGLSKALADVELIQTTWATSWFSVKTQLENMTDYFISYEQYEEMCAKEDITEKSAQDTLVDFLNDLGVILHFKDFELLDTHVLDPKWVTEAVYKIINSDQLAKSNGVLRLDLLGEILKKEKENDYSYPPDKYRFIIDLMKKFELCYEIDNETVLLPDLLEVQEPEFGFDYVGALKFVIDYDFLPKSVMPRFIVKMNKDIKNELRWRTGVVLEDKAFHSTAVIKADEQAEKIYIYVNGEQKRDYFSVILFNFREINRSFEKLKAIEKVPMPDEPEITVSYEHLIRLEQKGVEKYIPDGSENEYIVKDLLGTIYVGNPTEEEILQILRELKDKSDTEETLRQKANDVIMLKPNFMGVGIDVNSLIKKVFDKEKRK